MTKEPKPIDMIEQVGRMLTELADNRFAVPKLARAAGLAELKNERDDARAADTVVAISSAILALANEVRGVHNVLHEINMRLAAKE